MADTVCVVKKALSQVGVMEEGHNDGERVRQYLRSTNLGPSFPWCAAFQHWVLRQCGHVLQPSHEFAAAARFGREHIVWKKTGTWAPDSTGRLSRDGDVATLWYSNLNRIGHVFMITGENDDWVMTVEGNTGSGGEREGDGVYRRKRMKKTIYTVNRWP